jgi:hypothetical protein
MYFNLKVCASHWSFAKFKAEPVHAMKAYGGSRGIAPLIRKLHARWMPRPLYPCSLRTVL